MGQVIRQAEIKRRRARRSKIVVLRTKFAAAKTKKQKDDIIAKLGLIAPWLTEEQFLAPIKK